MPYILYIIVFYTVLLHLYLGKLTASSAVQVICLPTFSLLSDMSLYVIVQVLIRRCNVWEYDGISVYEYNKMYNCVIGPVGLTLLV